MLIVETPDLPPGACYITGRNDGPFLDTGYMIDDLAIHGRVYLAVSFLSDALDVIGGLGPDAAQILRERIEARDRRIVDLELSVSGLKDALESLLAAGYHPAPLDPPDEPADELNGAPTVSV